MFHGVFHFQCWATAMMFLLFSLVTGVLMLCGWDWECSGNRQGWSAHCLGQPPYVHPDGEGVQLARLQTLAYYRWSACTFLLQAVLFYAPHVLWRRYGGDYPRDVASVVQNRGLWARQANLRRKVNAARKVLEFCNRGKFMLKFFACNYAHLLGTLTHVYLTEYLLARPASPGEAGPVDYVFPQVAVCTTALCRLGADHVLDKLHIVAWLWLHALHVVAGLALACAVVSRCRFLRDIAARDLLGVRDLPDRDALVSRVNFEGLFFLHQLSFRVAPDVFKDILACVVADCKKGAL